MNNDLIAIIVEGQTELAIMTLLLKRHALKFDEDDLERYIASNLWRDKAGAMMIEGFNKKYIKYQKGNKPTAMGLDIVNLKAFL